MSITYGRKWLAIVLEPIRIMMSSKILAKAFFFSPFAIAASRANVATAIASTFKHLNLTNSYYLKYINATVPEKIRRPVRQGFSFESTKLVPYGKAPVEDWTTGAFGRLVVIKREKGVIVASSIYSPRLTRENYDF